MSTVVFSHSFTFVFFCFLLEQLLCLHPTSVVPAQGFYFIFSELFTMSCSLCLFWKNLPIHKKKQIKTWSFFLKSLWRTRSNVGEVEPHDKCLLGITHIIFWGVFRNSYYMESLQIINKLRGLHIVISVVMRNGNNFIFFAFFITIT